MSKSSVILICCTFLTGITLGFMDFSSSTEDDAFDTPSSRRPLLSWRMHHPRDIKLPLPTSTNISRLFPRYARLSPRETKEELLRLLHHKGDTRIDSYNAIHYLACKLGTQSPEDAKQLLDDKNKPVFWGLYDSLLQGWAEKDFEGAAAYLLAHRRDQKEAQRAFEQITRSLAQTNPAKAMQWAFSLQKGERAVALAALADEVPRNHPDQVKAFVNTLRPGDLNHFNVQHSLARSWAASDWESFKTWTDSLQGGYEKNCTFKYGISSLTEINPDKATEEFKKYEGEDKYEFANAIISGIDYEEKKKGRQLDWIVENVKDTGMAARLIEETIISNTDATPEMTKKILLLPEGEIRDAGLAKMVYTRSWMGKSNSTYTGVRGETSFHETMDLAAKIGDQSKRDNSTKECLKTWIETSPEDARQWISTKSQFPEQEKQKFLQDCDSTRKEKNSD